MITTERQYLKGTTKSIEQDICPVCGASRITLIGMLQEKPIIQEVEYRGMGGCVISRKEQTGAPNFNMAMTIIENCTECRKVFLHRS